MPRYISQMIIGSLRSWRDFAPECFCFGGEAVNVCGEAAWSLVRSRVYFFCESRALKTNGGSATNIACSQATQARLADDHSIKSINIADLPHRFV